MCDDDGNPQVKVRWRWTIPQIRSSERNLSRQLQRQLAECEEEEKETRTTLLFFGELSDLQEPISMKQQVHLRFEAQPGTATLLYGGLYSSGGIDRSQPFPRAPYQPPDEMWERGRVVYSSLFIDELEVRTTQGTSKGTK